MNQTLEVALERACRVLLESQDSDGGFRGALADSVAIEAEDILMREFLRIRDPSDTHLTAAWIRSQRRDDGAFVRFAAGPPDLSVSAMAYTALRLAGDSPEDESMLQTARAVRELGGVERSSVATRFRLALFGLWPWHRLPVEPSEVHLLGARVALPRTLLTKTISFHGRRFEVASPSALAEKVVTSYLPVRSLGFRIDELSVGSEGAARVSPHQRLRERLATLAGAASRYPFRRLHRPGRRARALCVQRILDQQESAGTWAGMYEPSILSLVALQLSGYPLDHPVMRKGLAGLDAFVLRERGTRRVEARPSRVWDTALGVASLSNAGLPPDHAAIVRAADWLLERELSGSGGWSEASIRCEPQIGDTVEVVMALRQVEHPEPLRVERAVGRAVAWTLGVQDRSGGWARPRIREEHGFDVAPSRLNPGADGNPPSADLTGRVIEMLAGEGLADDACVSRALEWVVGAQEGIGTWPGSSDLGALDATAAVVQALAAVGEKPASIPMQRSVQRLLSLQNADGGWADEHPVSEERRDSSAPHTACALLALLAAGARGEGVDRGAAWLVADQRPDGSWVAPSHVLDPCDLRRDALRLQRILPTLALGRYARVHHRRTP